MYRLPLIFIIPFFFFISCENNTLNNTITANSHDKDSISSFIENSKNTSLSIFERKKSLEKSLQILKSKTKDSFYTINLSTIAYQTLKLSDSLLFKKRNKEALVLAEKLRDTFSIGDIHWNYATYFSSKLDYDSAYYHFSKANHYFEMGTYLYEAATTQYGMAHIRGHFRDYSGSEILTFNAIKKFKKINDSGSLYTLYNHLAILQNDIQQYDEALQYHKTAIGYLKNINKSDALYQISLNNIGVTYFKMKKYGKAIHYFDEVLVDSLLKTKNLGRYARVIDNKAYCEFKKGDTLNVLNKLNEALTIRDSLNNKEGKIISMLNLSDYYKSTNKTIKAFSYAKKANQLAKEIKNSRDYLKSLVLLSEIDIKNGQAYFKQYVKFNDSLLSVERKTQNKFTRIDYETEQYIEETERLSELNTLILISSFGSFTILSLIYFIKIQRKRNTNLYLEAEQQKANEQFYILSLNQKSKLENEKVNERNRISEELHDGILGKLFGTRLSLSFLEMDLKKEVKTKYDSFLIELQTIEKEIREVSHKLNEDFDDSKTDFISLIQQLLDQNSKIGNFKNELIQNDEINWNNIDEITKVNLYKIIQESIFNIIKHSEANNVIIKFRFSNGHLNLSIIDNGFGFKQKRKPKGIGLKNIKSRIEKLDGSYEILSEKGEGTKILIHIPIK
jgi:signal transduction histidine kinase